MFHPILVTWFLVVFGNKVTKILCNSLFTFLLSKARQAEQKFKVKKITQPKTKLPKFVMSQAFITKKYQIFKITYLQIYFEIIYYFSKLFIYFEI